MLFKNESAALMLTWELLFFFFSLFPKIYWMNIISRVNFLKLVLLILNMNYMISSYNALKLTSILSSVTSNSTIFSVCRCKRIMTPMPKKVIRNKRYCKDMLRWIARKIATCVQGIIAAHSLMEKGVVTLHLPLTTKSITQVSHPLYSFFLPTGSHYWL